ncbi:acyl-phosphate glycerol 3-phosphate acyltransferase [bacterium TMED277]|nr:MAG: acyl-phosphate glycerol 3-phosphate acyltransferase [bacterium TMED277]
MDTIFIIISYLIGSIPFGLIGKFIFKIKDPRTFGSKNIGATNILRSGNKGAALFTLTLDMSKGLIIILANQSLQLDNLHLVIIAVVLGHMFPIYLFFKGGKGVATFFGVLIGLNLLCGVLTLFSWLIIFLCFKKSSLAALLSIILSNCFLFFLYDDFASQVAIFIVTIVIFYKHKSNIIRMINKEEFSVENPDKS